MINSLWESQSIKNKTILLRHFRKSHIFSCRNSINIKSVFWCFYRHNICLLIYRKLNILTLNSFQNIQESFCIDCNCSFNLHFTRNFNLNILFHISRSDQKRINRRLKINILQNWESWIFRNKFCCNIKHIKCFLLLNKNFHRQNIKSKKISFRLAFSYSFSIHFLKKKSDLKSKIRFFYFH